ncbi:glycosyltransferase family 2 protein [Mucilaginibacter corticis]|uniref:Glycosyltransferase family 2 protein n=1 Tax=Mucilaginibacter corticis TaxID=2597670 RepID=A0A556MLG1_9SPHI|nr:glycosyltransferase family 2 protein [Mucilaginibacter corticis]TSJ40761.1 glycosyltransferase family 2 protein [Mucilaginibacter corticis]
MTDKPLVSVIIPTYNRRDKIVTAIESALNQTYPNIQLIVSDDGSTDGTQEFIEKNYPTIDYTMNEHGGQASARNNGLAKAKGTIIASLDSDDKWNPDFVEACVEKLEKDNLDFVFANWSQQQSDGKITDFFSGDIFLQPLIRNKDAKWQDLSSEDLRDLYFKACPSPSSSAVIRKSSIVAGWNPKINICDDWCLFLDIIMSKKSKAAFTLDRHWNKFINNNNIYDGRARSEVLEFMYIKDTLEFIDRFKDKTTPAELLILNKRCVRGLVELSKHHAFRNFNVNKSAKLLNNAFKMDFLYTLQAIPDVLFFGVNRHLKDFIIKFQTKQARLNKQPSSSL